MFIIHSDDMKLLKCVGIPNVGYTSNICLERFVRHQYIFAMTESESLPFNKKICKKIRKKNAKEKRRMKQEEIISQRGHSVV